MATGASVSQKEKGKGIAFRRIRGKLVPIKTGKGQGLDFRTKQGRKARGSLTKRESRSAFKSAAKRTKLGTGEKVKRAAFFGVGGATFGFIAGTALGLVAGGAFKGVSKIASKLTKSGSRTGKLARKAGRVDVTNVGLGTGLGTGTLFGGGTCSE